MRALARLLGTLVALAACGPSNGQDSDPAAPVAAPESWLCLAPVDARGRRPFRPDAVFARHVWRDALPAPVAGESLTGETGDATWTARAVGEDGTVGGDRIGWAYATVESDAARVLLADLAGAAALWVNGTPAVGDVYRFGFGGVPVALEAGTNHLFVTGVRGSFRLRLTEPAESLFLASWDATLPDLVRGERAASELAVLLVNASHRPRARLEFAVEVGGLMRLEGRVDADVPALGLAKIPLPVWTMDPVDPDGDQVTVTVRLRDPATGDEASRELTLAVRPFAAARRTTFRSGIDDSVQEYAVLPPTASDRAAPDLALVLSLHGAGVSALGQAQSYAPSPARWLVAPTNRRPFGFDWQDWGRADAYEVLGCALRSSGVPRGNVSLTGHSMGGHGTWHLAANDPDGFAAIGPSAGWRGFDTYGGRPEGALRELWHAADAPSRTADFLDDLAAIPTYVLHGSDDDNVPASEARAMVAALEERGADVAAHFQEGAGHWWDDEGPGAACVDWPPMMELLESARIPAAPTQLSWTLADPAVDARHHWLLVEQPERWGRPVRVRASWDPETGAVDVTTENVRRLALTPVPGRPRRSVVVDGTVLPPGSDAEVLRAVRAEGGWEPADGAAPPEEKRAARSGPFKRAFDREFVLVPGTGGDPDHARALAQRARQDALAWWYRGNGRARVIPDREWVGRSSGLRGRNVILYGNRDVNAAWAALVPENAPLAVGDGWLTLGDHRWEGHDLACVAVLPRAGEDGTLVGLMGSTGAPGARLGLLLATFVSGVGYPDYAIWDGRVLAEGDGGVRAAGWFDRHWRPAPDGYVALD